MLVGRSQPPVRLSLQKLSDNAHYDTPAKSKYPRQVSNSTEHWDAAYTPGDLDRGWYQPRAIVSMELLARCDVAPDAAIVDVGSGASVFLDDALGAGYANLTAVDLSLVGMAISQSRLGAQAASVRWVHADVCTWEPATTFQVWHDRAVLHFLLDEARRLEYRETLLRATAPGSWALIGSFSQSGPPMCAGLPVRGASASDLAEFLGKDWHAVDTEDHTHVRPDGDTQSYVWVRAQRQ